MITRLTRNGYTINKKDITIKQLDKIKNGLTVTPFSELSGELESFKLFNETDTKIVLPRFYGIKKFGLPKITDIKSKSIDIKFNGTLRDKQISIVKNTYDHLIKHKGGILSVPCGFGKTTMALYIACQLKLKTLVIVHKTFLQDQWIERIKTFTNATVGLIRQNKVKVNADMVVGMIESISMRDYDKEIFDDFGLVIYDEVHHVGSRVFSRALMKTGATYLLGLSATPNRSDGLTKILFWFIGDICHKQDIHKDKNVIVKTFHYHTKHPLFVEKTRYFKGEMKPNIPVMINNLVKITERTKHLINMIYTLITYCPDRKIIVLSDRVNHLKYIKSAIDKLIEADEEKGKKEKGECKTCYYIGELKQSERKEAETEGDILFATYGMAKEALDIERLNTIIFATPQKNIVQAVGRIMRKLAKDTGIKPLIIDFVDEIRSFSRHYKKRLNTYQKCLYKVENYYLEDDQIITNKEYVKLKFGHSKVDTDYEPLYEKIFEEDNDIIEENDEKPEKIEKKVYYFSKKDFKEYIFD